MRNKVTILIIAFLIIIPLIFIASCLFIPKTVPEDERDQECLLVTRSLTIDYYTSSDMIDEGVDEMLNAIKSDCREPECLILFAHL